MWEAGWVGTSPCLVTALVKVALKPEESMWHLCVDKSRDSPQVTEIGAANKSSSAGTKTMSPCVSRWLLAAPLAEGQRGSCRPGPGSRSGGRLVRLSAQAPALRLGGQEATVQVTVAEAAATETGQMCLGPGEATCPAVSQCHMLRVGDICTAKLRDTVAQGTLSPRP